MENIDIDIDSKFYNLLALVIKLARSNIDKSIYPIIPDIREAVDGYCNVNNITHEDIILLRGYPKEVEVSLRSGCICGITWVSGFHPSLSYHCWSCEGKYSAIESIVNTINSEVGYKYQTWAYPINRGRLDIEILKYVNLN